MCINAKGIIVARYGSSTVSSLEKRNGSHVLHPPNLLFIGVLFQATVFQRLPPLEQHTFAYQLEPRCVFQLGVLSRFRFGVHEHLSQFIPTHPSHRLHLVFVDLDIRIGLDEEYVVNLVLAPLPIAGREIMNSRQKSEGLNRYVFGRDPQFMVEFSDPCSFRPLHI